jgi:hypothetical protein
LSSQSDPSGPTSYKANLMLYERYLKVIPLEGPNVHQPKALNIENLYLDKNFEKKIIFLNTDIVAIDLYFSRSDEVVDWYALFSKFCVRVGLSLDYKLLDKIGKGGFGSVYKAKDLKNGGIVAMKVIEKSRIKTVKNYVNFFLNFRGI